MYALDKYNWSIELFTIGETFHYFVYVMTKGAKLTEADKNFYCRKNLFNKKECSINPIELEENNLFHILVD